MSLKRFHLAGNVAGLFLLSVLFSITFYVQLAFHDLPCPLCLLQRIGFAGVGVAIVFNLSLEIRARHYGLMLLSALFGFAAAMRHLFLHIMPNDPGYGLPIFGLHMHTWSALIFVLVMILGAIALVFDNGFHKVKTTMTVKSSMWLFMIMLALNAFSSLLECGVDECPADPVVYQLLNW